MFWKEESIYLAKHSWKDLFHKFLTITNSIKFMKVIAPYHKLFKVQYFYLEIALESWWIVEPRALLSRLIIYSFSIIWSSAASEFDKIKVGEKTTYEKPGIFMVIKWNQTSFRRVFFCIKGNKRLLVISKKWIHLNLGSQRNFKRPFFACKNSGKAYSSI